MENKEQVVCDAFEADIPLDVIAAESGLGRSTIYRWHERWRNASQAAVQV